MHTCPHPIGPNSESAFAALSRGARSVLELSHDPFDRDTQLGWFMINEASFGSWSDVPDHAEWNPAVVDLRRQFESWFSETIDVDLSPTEPAELVDSILSGQGISASRYLAELGTRDQVRESLMLRYPYQIKEADPHTFAIPRLTGQVKRALCEIQSGEYGVGHRSTHAELYRSALSALSSQAEISGVLGRLPGIAFATSNLVSMGGLNRSRRGLVLGQLALFEMDSVKPNSSMVQACDRLGLPEETRRFFEVHVFADEIHEEIARQAFLIDYPTQEPDQLRNLLFGIQAQHLIDTQLSEESVEAWIAGRGALEQGDETENDRMLSLSSVQS